MPTTYTPSLRLWQGQPGDPAIKNAWGVDLNTNDNLLEAGLLGTVVVNVAGLVTYTLTTANGAADQARNYVQQYTGALTADCAVTLPNVPKIGWAQNSTTGGHNVVLTTGAGTTYTVPPDGSFHWYRVDGSGNVTSPTVAYNFTNLNVPGNLTVVGTLSVTGAATFNAAGTGLAVAHNATVGGTLTVVGRADLNGGATLPNNVPLFGKDTAGNEQIMLRYGGDNNTYIFGGTAGKVIIADTTASQTFATFTETQAQIDGVAYLNGAITMQLSGQAFVIFPTSQTIQVSPTGTFSAILAHGLLAPSVYVNSDARIKANKELISEDVALRTVMNVDGYFFDLEDSLGNTLPRSGVLAQQLLRTAAGRNVFPMPKEGMPAARNHAEGPEGMMLNVPPATMEPFLLVALRNALRRLGDAEDAIASLKRQLAVAGL